MDHGYKNSVGHSDSKNTGPLPSSIFKMHSVTPPINETGLQYSLSEYAPVYQQSPEHHIQSPPKSGQGSLKIPPTSLTPPTGQFSGDGSTITGHADEPHLNSIHPSTHISATSTTALPPIAGFTASQTQMRPANGDLATGLAVAGYRADTSSMESVPHAWNTPFHSEEVHRNRDGMLGSYTASQPIPPTSSDGVISGRNSVLQHRPTSSAASAPLDNSKPHDPSPYHTFQHVHPDMGSSARTTYTPSGVSSVNSTTLSAAPEMASFAAHPISDNQYPTGQQIMETCPSNPAGHYTRTPAPQSFNAHLHSSSGPGVVTPQSTNAYIPPTYPTTSMNRPMYTPDKSAPAPQPPFCVPSTHSTEALAQPHLGYPPPTQYYSHVTDQMRTVPVPPPPTSFATTQPVPTNASVRSIPPTPPQAAPLDHKQPPSYVRPGTMPTSYPPYQRQPPSGIHDPNAIYRSPGTPATVSEWSRLKAPIALLQDRELLPSDGPDLPIKPAITNPVNCDPDVMRCTLTNVPSSSKLLSRCRLPLGLVMHPFRDLSSLHTINSKVIVRCRSCRTYINPFVQFLDSGRRWRCPVCFLANSVPDDFYYDPSTQTYGDPSRRPEIRSATVEFIAPSEYMLRPPQPATYLFCFDVSRNAISTGYLRFVCERLAASINRMPGDSRRQIAFITYDSAVHFYKLCGDTMRLMICPDLDDPFLPDYEGLINRIEGSAEAIQEFLLQLPDSFATTGDVGNCLGSALQIALKLIGGTGGRISAFTTCMPTVGAGVLHSREDPNDRTSSEGKNLGPAIDFYKTFALDCAAQQVAVDLFFMNSQYCDIATISGVSRFSSGAVYHYPNFYCPPKSHEKPSSGQLPAAAGNTETSHSNCDLIEMERFRRDFDRYLTRKIGFEAVMRIRCTHGLSIQAFHGCFFVRSTDLMSLPNVSPDAGFAVQLNLTESLDKYTTVCCQSAILYTSANGDRRIRVHTLCLPVVHNPIEVFQGADQGAIACLIGKMAVDRAISSGVSNAREALANSVADAMSAFSATTGLPVNNMAFPPNLRLLPLYVCGLLRYRAFNIGPPVPLDVRSSALERLKSSPPEDMLSLVYPRLYAVHQFISKPMVSSAATLAQKAATLSLCDGGDSRIDASAQSDGEDEEDSSSSSETSDIPNEAEQLPGQLPLTARSITRNGVYLLDTGELLLLLVGSGEDTVTAGSNKSSEMLQNLLGISSPMELPSNGGPFSLPSISGDPTVKESANLPVGRRRLAALITLLRRRRPHDNALVCMRHDAPANLKTKFLSALIEDRTEWAASYHEFLQMVQNLMKV